MLAPACSERQSGEVRARHGYQGPLRSVPPTKHAHLLEDVAIGCGVPLRSDAWERVQRMPVHGPSCYAARGGTACTRSN